jgi:HEAT repeat protein
MMNSTGSVTLRLVVSLVAAGLAVESVVAKVSQETRQAVVRSEADFRIATASEKREALAALGRRTIMLPPSELSAVARAALDDGDPQIRLDACEMIAAKAAGVRLGADAQRRQESMSDRSALVALQGRLVSLLKSDPDERVRRWALVAAGNLDYDPQTLTGSGTSMILKLSRQFVDSIAAAYSHEQATGVRAEIIKTLALSESESAMREVVLSKALSDVAPSVLQFAIRGIASMKAVRALPRIAQLLSHDDRSVRLAAAQSLATFGAAARPFVPTLERALQNEPDDVVARTIRGTIAVINRGKGQALLH